MNNALRYGGWALLALALLWVVAELVGIVFGVVSWLVSSLVTVLVVAVLLYFAYSLVSRLGGGGTGPAESRTREREEIFE